jgi:hypothetical protein
VGCNVKTIKIKGEKKKRRNKEEKLMIRDKQKTKSKIADENQL